MKHAVVVAHPNLESLTLGCAGAYREAAEAAGHEVIVRDLYRMGFDPCLKPSEVPGPKGYAAAPDVAAERKLLVDVDVFALVYPLWFNAPPAILKGYVDRVFSMGFGYGPAFGGTEPKLVGKRLISVTFSGAPDHWIRDTGGLDALLTVFDRHLASMCGLQLLDHLHFGGIVAGIRPEAAEEILADVRARVRQAFAPAPSGASPSVSSRHIPAN
jgi:NAD(P)H dehydrogenase (quinone)